MTTGWLGTSSVTVSPCAAYLQVKFARAQCGKKPLMATAAMLPVLAAWLF